ncbi:hypothetical protein [Sinorhizobium meliloti]|uniref:hypothetical protein n=1 Tax=Rhizobium meliloti TaxID=382 RepID=UPI000414F84E|nr:hypothetical protein [Sinorhizobium meliloti]
MTDRPILFSGPMVRALLDGRKTQTRRILKPQPPEWATFCQQPTMLNTLQQWVPSGLWACEDEQSPPRPLRRWPVNADGEHYWLRPRFSIGDRLYVREHWRTASVHDKTPPRDLHSKTIVEYVADNDNLTVGKFRQGMHMPRWASRLTLIVTDVRVERLQDISEEDAIAEGIFQLERKAWIGGGPLYGLHEGEGHDTAVGAYNRLWRDINGDGSWAANPWVAAYSFRVIKENIDRIEKVAA